MNRLLRLFFITALLSTVCSGKDFPGVRCLTFKFEKERVELARSSSPGLQKTITRSSANEVGDTLNFWVLKHNPLFDTIKAVCKAVGEHSYIFVETGMWDQGFVDDTDVEQLLMRFEEQTFADTTRGIFDMMLDNFGQIPDALDNDPRVYIVIQDLASFGDGYFMFFDQYTQEQINNEFDISYKSNEKEILYLNARNDVSSDLMLSVAAHELEHMIHWNTDPDEESWIDEGCAELAMYHFGYPDPIVLFNLFPDNDLTMWDSGFADYVQTYLFTMYLYEHYGGTGTIKTLLSEEANGIDGINNTLYKAGYTDNDFSTVFSDWVIANYLDNKDFDAGWYNYGLINLPQFEASWGFSRYPIDEIQGSVSPWAADYIWMNNGQPLSVNFDGNDNGKFHVSVVKIGFDSNVFVDNLILDDNQHGSYDLPDFGSMWDQIVLVVSNQESFSPTQYSFSSTLITGIEQKNAVPVEFSLKQNYPNPFSLSGRNAATTIEFSVPSADKFKSGGTQISNAENGIFVELKVYDILGREVATLVNGHKHPGTYKVEFSAQYGSAYSGDISPISSGAYFYRLNSDNFSDIRKMIILK